MGPGLIPINLCASDFVRESQVWACTRFPPCLSRIPLASFPLLSMFIVPPSCSVSVSFSPSSFQKIFPYLPLSSGQAPAPSWA